MLRFRVIPILLMQDSGLVKGVKFKNHKYVGDPINAVKIFNDKEVDELVFLDIEATKKKLDPNYSLISDIATEAFIPFAYGGGINNVQQAAKLFKLGVEKIVINTAAYENMQLIKDLAKEYGSSAVMVAVDFKKNFWGSYEGYVRSGTKKVTENIFDYIKKIEDHGAGELVVSSIDRDGTGKGYDLDFLSEVSKCVNIPVVALGGASGLDDFKKAILQAKVSAVAAGDYFVFKGKHKAVLITYPNYNELEKILSSNE